MSWSCCTNRCLHSLFQVTKMEEEMMLSPAYVKKMTGVRNDEDEDSGNRMSSFNNAVSASS